MTPRAPRIVILTGNHLCHNPRVLKEAACLADAGFDVEVMGASLDPELAGRDRELVMRERFRYSATVRLRRDDGSFRTAGQVLRAQRWVGTRLQRWFGIEHPAALGYGAGLLLRAARARPADLYIAHSEPALWAAAQLARAGRRIGVDMEDWFSRDLLPAARRDRPLRLLASLERATLAAAVHSTCPSQAMSEALAGAYGVAPPRVTYNTFPWSERAAIDGRLRDRADRSTLSLHWFSQTVGPGRGLEDLFGALPHLSRKAHVHLRGNAPGTFVRELMGRLPGDWRPFVSVHPLVRNGELLSRVAEHDIGLALDPEDPANRNLTVTNKLFQYLQGGLAVVATATAGHTEIARSCGSGIRLYRAGDTLGLAAALDELMAQPVALARAKADNLSAAEARFCWERTGPALLAGIESAIRATVPH